MCKDLIFILAHSYKIINFPSIPQFFRTSVFAALYPGDRLDQTAPWSGSLVNPQGHKASPGGSPNYTSPPWALLLVCKGRVFG